jgi:hypothetical protein
VEHGKMLKTVKPGGLDGCRKMGLNPRGIWQGGGSAPIGSPKAKALQKKGGGFISPNILGGCSGRRCFDFGGAGRAVSPRAIAS